ncbi:MAG: serine/threonine protein kinase, partial [Myxococcales bacterium]|nr:serine/threonine protein kinase [Myxococcales bacterium]
MSDAAETTADPRPWELADRLIQARVEAQLLGRATEATTLGRYRIERGLGAGAMGRLLLAVDPDLQRPVALKLLTPARVGSPEARRRIVREARAMARLSDPHVAQVYEVGEADGQLYVAMEHIDGQDLRAWLDERARPWPEVLAVFRQAGAGLAAAHQKGIVHRDLKPDNVMLEHDGRARVIDFGLAFPGSSSGGEGPGLGLEEEGPVELTQTGVVLGTPAYMAPEQWGGAADARSDQYSFCVALFEALTGRRPFDGETVAELQRAQHHTRLRWSGAVPRWVRGAVERGLAMDPEARWPDMRALVRALDPARRRRRQVVAGLGVLAAVAGGLALRPAADPCRDAGAELDASWGPPQREAIARAGSEVGTSWATETTSRLLERMDVRAEAWRETARGLCAAARGEAPPDAAASSGCMEESRRRLEELVAAASSAEPSQLVSALAQAELLPDPRACPEAPAAVFGGGAPAAVELRAS